MRARAVFGRAGALDPAGQPSSTPDNRSVTAFPSRHQSGADLGCCLRAGRKPRRSAVDTNMSRADRRGISVPARVSSSEGSLPQPIRTSRPARAPVAQQRSARQFPSPRQAREQDWKALVGTLRLLSRLVVERTKHHLPDDADALARQAVLIEEELQNDFPTRWPLLHPQLLLEEATWWAEEHDDDLLNCRSCQLQNGIASERIDVTRPRRVPA